MYLVSIIVTFQVILKEKEGMHCTDMFMLLETNYLLKSSCSNKKLAAPFAYTLRLSMVC